MKEEFFAEKLFTKSRQAKLHIPKLTVCPGHVDVLTQVGLLGNSIGVDDVELRLLLRQLALHPGRQCLHQLLLGLGGVQDGGQSVLHDSARRTAVDGPC